MYRIKEKHIWYYDSEKHKAKCLDYWVVQKRILFIWWTLTDTWSLEIRFEAKEHAEEYMKYLINYEKEERNDWL